jgi:hypothetical protein
MGAGHELQIDGIGGGNPLTSKAAIVGPSLHPGADVDYLCSPRCGSGSAPSTCRRTAATSWPR